MDSPCESTEELDVYSKEHLLEMYEHFKKQAQKFDKSAGDSKSNNSTDGASSNSDETISATEEEEYEENGIDNEVKESKREELAGCLKCLIAFFLTIGVILLQSAILENNWFRNTVLVSDNTKDNSFRPGCSSNSFMIKDGVCDELTNIEKCLFDGGDCCDADKSEEFCNHCKCMIDIDFEELKSSYVQYNVKAFKNLTAYNNLLTDIPKYITQVVSLHTCSVICMSDDLANSVNSWSFDFTSKLCNCTWVDIDATLCMENLDFQPMTDFAVDLWYEPKVALVQTAKSLPCDCMMMNVKHNNGSISFDGSNLRDPPSVWHCQKECQRSQFCSFFSWKHSLGLKKSSKGTCSLFEYSPSSIELVNTTNWWVTGPGQCLESHWSHNISFSDNFTATTITDPVTVTPTTTVLPHVFPDLILIGGKTANGQFNVKPQILTVNGNVTVSDCNADNIPDSVTFATGGILTTDNGTRVGLVCGGQGTDIFNPKPECYIVGQSEPLTSMSIPRIGAVSVEIWNQTMNESALWVTGGWNPMTFHRMNTTEFIFASGQSLPGPDLPHVFNRHCIAKFSQTQFVFVGSDSSSLAWLYDGNLETEQERWSTRAVKGSDREAHSCGIIKDSRGLEQQFLVIAGGVKGSHVNSETFDAIWCFAHDFFSDEVSQFPGTTRCKTLEQGFTYFSSYRAAASFVNYWETKWVLFGGNTLKAPQDDFRTSVSFVECSGDHCKMETFEGDPKLGRSEMVALPLPLDSVTC